MVGQPFTHDPTQTVHCPSGTTSQSVTGPWIARAVPNAIPTRFTVCATCLGLACDLPKQYPPRPRLGPHGAFLPLMAKR